MFEEIVPVNRPAEPSADSAPAKIDSTPKSDKAKAILAGALEVFKKDGYAAASMDRIATAAKVSKPTLYTHFKNKEGLFVALIQQMAVKNAPAGSHGLIAGAKTPLSPEEMLYKIATNALDEFSGDRTLATLMRLIIGESERFPELAHIFIREISQPNLDRLAAYLASEPQLNLPDPMVAARIFIGSIVHYIITQNIMNGHDLFPLERDRMVKGLVHQMLAGSRT